MQRNRADGSESAGLMAVVRLMTPLELARAVFTALGAATWIQELDSRLAAASSSHR